MSLEYVTERATTDDSLGLQFCISAIIRVERAAICTASSRTFLSILLVILPIALWSPGSRGAVTLLSSTIITLIVHSVVALAPGGSGSGRGCARVLIVTISSHLSDSI